MKIIIGIISLAFSVNLSAQTIVKQASWPDIEWNVKGDLNQYSIKSNPTLVGGDAMLLYKDFDDYDHFYLESPVIDLSAPFNASKTEVYIEFNLEHPLVQENEISYFMTEYWDEDTKEWLEIDKENINSSSTVTEITCASSEVKKSAKINIKAFSDTQLKAFKYRFKYFDNAWKQGFCLSSPVLYANIPESLGTTQNEINTNLKLFPNPSTDFLTIKNISKASKGSIVNLLGVELKKVYIENEHTLIDIRQLPKGIYILKLENSASFEFLKK